MNTRIITSEIHEAAEIIRNGGLVAVPTETVYGLAGCGMNEDARKSSWHGRSVSAHRL